ncbi:hypothetical protein LCGC14_2025780 [marine sediment metagenome]|uniref:Acylneuraminate cytidylyltransferase n=1 Tax=marine sediment metagenome TaxID=412755 RepID=A0A0F9H9K6_9ZZZZ
MKPKVVAIIQARMGAARLPGKVLLGMVGQTVLSRVINRVEMAETIDRVVVATTVEPGDDAIDILCDEMDWLCFRGDEEDVTDRYYKVALFSQADIVVRITADCPLIDSETIDIIVGKFLEEWSNIDYVSNLLPRTYPRGLDTEVFSFNVLEREWANSVKHREHVTLRLRNNIDNYRIANISATEDYSWMRWTLDTVEDLEFARKVYGHFGEKEFNWMDIVGLLDTHPEWVIFDKDPVLEKNNEGK